MDGHLISIGRHKENIPIVPSLVGLDESLVVQVLCYLCFLVVSSFYLECCEENCIVEASIVALSWRPPFIVLCLGLGGQWRRLLLFSIEFWLGGECCLSPYLGCDLSYLELGAWMKNILEHKNLVVDNVKTSCIYPPWVEEKCNIALLSLAYIIANLFPHEIESVVTNVE